MVKAPLSFSSIPERSTAASGSPSGEPFPELTGCCATTPEAGENPGKRSLPSPIAATSRRSWIGRGLLARISSVLRLEARSPSISPPPFPIGSLRRFSWEQEALRTDFPFPRIGAGLRPDRRGDERRLRPRDRRLARKRLPDAASARASGAGSRERARQRVLLGDPAELGGDTETARERATRRGGRPHTPRRGGVRVSVHPSDRGDPRARPASGATGHRPGRGPPGARRPGRVIQRAGASFLEGSRFDSASGLHSTIPLARGLERRARLRGANRAPLPPRRR